MNTSERHESKVATAARIYDYYIGGTHNFPADRAAAKEAMVRVPLLRPAARANRAFLGRAVRFAVESGIHQFLDIGSGIPTAGNVHEVAQEVDPDARVVYVDIDPVAVAEGLAILDGNPNATSIGGNLLAAEAILANRSLRGLLDLSQPVAIILCAVLHFVTENAQAQAAVAGLRGACVPGSYLILSHGTRPGEDAPAEQRDRFAAEDKLIKGVYENRTTTPVGLRPRGEVQRFFEGYDLVEPGLTWVSEWRPNGPQPEEFGGDASQSLVLGGVGILR